MPFRSSAPTRSKNTRPAKNLILELNFKDREMLLWDKGKIKWLRTPFDALLGSSVNSGNCTGSRNVRPVKNSNVATIANNSSGVSASSNRIICSVGG